MATEAVTKFQPNRSIALGGFDRRGCAAAISSASATGFTVSGVWSDSADFVVLNLFNVDDDYGHYSTTRFLPDGDLTGVVLSYHCAITNGWYPGSEKYASVPWGSLSWIDTSGNSGTTPLNPTVLGGGVYASRAITIGGTPATGDRFQIVYLGNEIADYTCTAGGSGEISVIATALTAQINALSSTFPIHAAITGTGVVTVSCTAPGIDGNTIELWTMFTTTASATMSPLGATKLASGADPSSFKINIDFSALGLTSLSRAWLTFAPPLPIDTSDADQTLKPFVGGEFSYVFTSWAVASSNANLNLKIAGPGSVIIGSQDNAVKTFGAWSQVAGAYYRGFAWQSGSTDDRITLVYNCQYGHNVYIGTLAGSDQGSLIVTVDGAATTIDCSVGSGSVRRLVASGIAAGHHVVTVAINAGACVFDCIQAAVLSDILPAAVTYSGVNTACDFDTNETGFVAPEALLWRLQHLGFTGDLDFYAGVFFALKRVRAGGSFPVATITIAGAINTGTGTGNGSSVFISLGQGAGTTTIGAAAYPADTLTSLAQRLVNGINGTFVGVWAAPTMTAGQFTVTLLSPVNSFPLNVSVGDPSLTPTITVSGISGDPVNGYSLGPGNEGTWVIDPTQTSAPLNRAFHDWIVDFCGIVHSAGQTMTIAYSQEALGAPDVNTSAGAWLQRYASGVGVLTNTGFGQWGSGYINSVTSSVYNQPGHGYLTGYTLVFTSAADSTITAAWTIAVVDANNYTLVQQTAGSTTYGPVAGDSVYAELVTGQMCFGASPTAYLTHVFVQTANIMAAAGLTPWLQFGEILWWFFSETHSNPITEFFDDGGAIGIVTAQPHGLSASGSPTPQVILAGTGFCDGTVAIATVDDPYTFSVVTSWPGGAPVAAGTVSGGGMAFYDAATAAAGGTGVSFYTQDDSPAGYSSAVAFLYTQIYNYIGTIMAAVLSAQSGAKFELLYPFDVNFPTCYYTAALPYPQGGRLNTVVNLPGAYYSPGSSGLSRFKGEALSWQSFYFNFDNFVAMVAYPISVLGGWPKADTAILIGWNYGGAPWVQAWLYSQNQSIPLVNFWAVDHDAEFSWPATLPSNEPVTQV